MSSIPPKGTAHRRKFTENKQSVPRACTSQELDGLEEKLAGLWGFRPRAYQMDGIVAQLKRQDVIIHAGTGMGKTAIAAGPHAHASAKGKITLMVSPLIALHDEMVDTFKEEFNLSATSVNSSNGGCAPAKLQKIVSGEWQIVLISPEQLLSRSFIKNVLKDAGFKQRLLSVVIDEAHVISHWGNGFRKKYGELGNIRSFLLKSTPIVALSATMPPRVRRDVLRVLRFDQKNFINIDIGNDRPNVSIVVRGIHHPLNTYIDLDFVIDNLANTHLDIAKTFVYCDNIAMGTEIIDHLTERLPGPLRALGIIRPYNACFSKEYRKAVMQSFRDGDIRVLVCTDAAGMGCNIPDIDLVVQWKVPGTISAFIQRAGRCARAAERVGLAVLLAEPSVYCTILDKSGRKPVKESTKKGTATTGTSQEHSNETSKSKKLYGVSRGSKRGSGDSALNDAILIRDCPAVDEEAEDEGLFSLIQSGTCRRLVLRRIYGNNLSQLTVPCCDICDPSLLNQTRPGARADGGKTSRVKIGMPYPPVVAALHDWRCRIKRRDFDSSLFNASAILSDSLVDTLACVGPVPTRLRLSEVLGCQWGWEKTYGDELFSAMAEITIPSFVPLPKKPRAMKRSHGGEQDKDEPEKKKKPPVISEFERGIPRSCQFTFNIPQYFNDVSSSALASNHSSFAVLTEE